MTPVFGTFQSRERPRWAHPLSRVGCLNQSGLSAIAPRWGRFFWADGRPRPQAVAASQAHAREWLHSRPKHIDRVPLDRNKMELLAPLARELVALNVDVIVTSGAEAVNAAKEATTTIPIVMTAVQDAVADGLVESLAHPGGNVTGRSVYAQELTSKRMELLKDVVPGLLRVGVLWNAHVAG